MMILSLPERRDRTRSIRNGAIATQTHEYSCLGAHIPIVRMADPVASGFLVARQCHLWCVLGAPLMTGALMSARYDMEAAEPTMGQLRGRVDVIRVDPVSAVEVRPMSVTGLHCTCGVG